MNDTFIKILERPLPLILLISLAGLTFSKIFRKLNLPGITGQLVLGVFLGQILSHNSLDNIKIISVIALGIMTFTVGTHLNYKKIHNSWQRIVSLAFFDITITYFLTFGILTAFTDLSFVCRLLISSLAVETAPGTVIHLIQGKKARGPLVKTLLGVVALNNVATIVIFEICRKIAISSNQNSWFDYIKAPVGYSLLAIAIGTITGFILANLLKHVHKEKVLFGYTFLAILFNIVVCMFFNGAVSPLLVNLATGIVLGNSSYHIKKVLYSFDGLNLILFTVFFTIAGTHLHLSSLVSAGITGAIFAVARATGKISAPFITSTFCKMPNKLRNNLGFSLIPQAGLAVGLVVTLEKYPQFTVDSNVAAIVSGIILAAVTINEIVGPLTASKAFDLANETDQANTRLIDFLHEEYIKVPLKANDKWDAIRQLCDFLAKTHHMKISKAYLNQVVREREEEFSTGLGNGIALPHARIEGIDDLMGVIGILDKPIDFESLDGQPVRVIILLATPTNKIDLHLKVCQTVGKIFTTDKNFFEKLSCRETPEEVYDLLQSKEIRDMNYFIDA